MAEARLILRPMLGPITLGPAADGALWASYGVNFSALIKAGQGGPMCSFPTAPILHRVKVR